MQKKTNKAFESWQTIQKNLKENFHHNLEQFRKFVKSWRDKELFVTKDNTGTTILIEYATCVEEVNNNDRLKGLYFSKTIQRKDDMRSIKDQKEMLMGFSLFDQKAWKINFGKKFIEKLKLSKEDLVYKTFSNLYAAVQGYIHFTQGKNNTFKAYKRHNESGFEYYTYQMETKEDLYYLLVSVGAHKFPNFNFNNPNVSKIESFSYQLMITAQDLINQQIFQDQTSLQMILDRIEQFYAENPRTNYERQELVQKEMPEKLVYYHTKKRDSIQLGIKIYPTLYNTKKLDYIDSIDYEFLLENFDDYQIRISYLQHQNKKKENQYQEVEYKKIQFESLSNLIQQIQKMPGFPYPLSYQQRKAIYTYGNQIIVGRSGTGKTTCGMLRLYGIQLYLKFNEFKLNEIQVTNEKCKHMLMDDIKLMKNVFLTSSGKLIDQIKKLYDDLIFQVKLQQSKKCQICRRNLQAQSQQNQNEDIFDRLQRLQSQKQNKVASLGSISNLQYPAFFTIQNFIKLIDKSILRPFFCHKNEHQQRIDTKKYIKYAFINRYKYTALTETVKATYVDYNFFLNQIWKNLRDNSISTQKQFELFTPAVVWAQIFSILKGSLNSYLYPQGYISFKMYLKEARSIFNRKQRMREYKEKVYKILKIYMNWCKQSNAYDLMDVVNHNLRQIEFYGSSVPKMNYMFIDEVQDLTSATTFLISKMVTNNIYYSGDTAQAITKGVSFRFQDIKLIFNQQYCKNAIQMQPPQDPLNLTVNFRSHHFILQLADLMVGSIQTLFPNSITQTKRQKSTRVGPMSYIMIDQSLDMLYQLMCGPRNRQNQQQNMNQNLFLRDLISKSIKMQYLKQKKLNKKKKKQQQQQMIESDGYEQPQDDQKIKQARRFNHQQIIIVRNIKEKFKLPKSLRREICFTPQTAKGLQYDEVILFNFFSSCPLFDKWESLLSHLEPGWTWIDQQKFDQKFKERSIQEKGKYIKLTDQEKRLMGYDEGQKAYKIWNLKEKDTLKGINIDLFLQMETELKILYTAITRARSSFSIFDTKVPKKLLDLWNYFKFITQINQNNVQECFRERNKYITETEPHRKYHDPKKHWFDAGVQMLRREDYENAKKCFTNIRKFDLVDRIFARELQIKAQKQQYRIEYSIGNLEKLTRMQRKITKKKLEQQQKQVNISYIDAGRIYRQYKRFKDAADAFFKGQDYNSAFKMYEIIKDKGKVAECCKRLKRYDLAIKIFKQFKDVQGLIECYKQQQNWQQIHYLIIDNQEYIKKIGKFQDIILRCIKQIIKSKLEKLVREDQRFYNNWNIISIEQQIKRKKIYCEQQKLSQVKHIILQYQKKNVQKIIAYLTSQLNQVQALYKQMEKINERLIFLYQQQVSIKQKKQAIRSQKEEIKKNMDYYQQQIQKYQSIYLIQQLQDNWFYLDWYDKLNRLNIQKNQINAQKQQLQQKSDFIEVQIMNLQQKYHQAQSKLYNLSQNYIYQKLQPTINKLKRLDNRQPLSSQDRILNPQPESIGESYYDDQISQLRSVSDLSEMGQLWVQDDSIGGLNFSSDKKEQILALILIDLNLSENILENVIEKDYDPYHHKYIQQKLIRLLKYKPGQLINTEYLKKLVMIQQNKSGLLLCDIHRNFTCLSPKFILGYLLDYSKNFAYNRHFKEERYQFIIRQQQDQHVNSYRIQLSQIQKVLASLNVGGLKHKIPRLAFENMFYYESILENIMFGLLLQGYFNEILIFCKLGAACSLAYLYSSYGKLVNTIRNIAQDLKIKIMDKDQFLFVTDQRIYQKYPEARVLNIFTIQNLFNLYDQCQDEPFLSKRVSLQKFDIEQALINHYMTQIVNDRIQIMINTKQNCFNKTKQLIAQNDEFKRLINTNTKKQKDLQKLYQAKSKKYEQQRKVLQAQLIQLQGQMDYLQTKRQIAQYILKVKVTSIQQKENYEKKIQTLIFQRDQAEGLRETTRINQQIEKLEEQYKIKRQEHEEAFKHLKTLQKQIQQKRKCISDINQRIKDMLAIIQKLFNDVKNPQLWKHQYLEYIKHNQQLIREEKEKIPKPLENLNKQQLKQEVLNILIREQQQQRYLDNQKKIREKNMQKIQRKCHIPYIACYNFINKYIKGQLNQYSYENTRLYYQILIDAKDLQQLCSRKIQQTDIKICNIFIFYLSYIFNYKLRMNIDDSIRIATQQYFSYHQQRSKKYMKIRQLKKNIEICHMKLSKFTKYRQHQMNKNDLKKLEDQLNFIQKDIEQTQVLPLNPLNLFIQFFDIMEKNIKKLQPSRIYFMDILFGFFQCRIIRQCQLLDFLANEYVLVKQSSIVIEKLLKQGKYNFAYYFDQDNQTILCRFEDVQRIIRAFILQKHYEIIQTSNIRPNDSKHQGKIKKEYINRQFFGYPIRLQTDEDKFMLSATQLSNPLYYYQIKSAYDVYLHNSYIKQIKEAKKKILEQYLRDSNKNTDVFFFIYHQLRQHHFLEKTILNMNQFNYILLEDISNKKNGLKTEYQNYKQK